MERFGDFVEAVGGFDTGGVRELKLVQLEDILAVEIKARAAEKELRQVDQTGNVGKDVVTGIAVFEQEFHAECEALNHFPPDLRQMAMAPYPLG